MKRTHATHSALAVLTSVAAGAAVVYGCIPTPDTSGLPPYDAGPSPIFDANITSSFDAGDANVVTSDDAGSQDSGTDSGPGTGTIRGVVIDFTQGNGSGVVPGATVAVLNGQQTVTDAYGTFTLTGVPAGPVQLNVGKATDTVNHIAYSTTQTVFTLASGQTLSTFPVLHEGCYEKVTFPGTVTPVKSTDTGMLCPNGTTGADRAGAYASLTYSSTTAFANAGGTVYTGTARIEMIPIAFPVGTPTDYSWGAGLPGASTPVETIGAMQLRIVDDTSNAPLAVRASETVGVTMETTRAFTTGENFALYSYDPIGAAWNAVPSANAPQPGTVSDGADDTQLTTGATTTVPSLPGSWLALTKPAQPTSCVTGTVSSALGAAAGVVVRGVGATYLGTSTAVTDATGKFCLDVAAAPTDGGTGPSVEVLGGQLTAGGTVLTAPATPSTVTTSSGSCATGTTGCTALAPITLVAVDPTCISGVVSTGEDAAAGETFDVGITQIEITSGQRNAGIQQQAYVGTLTTSATGAFCAPGIPGATMRLTDPTLTNGCYVSLPAAQVGGTLVTCGAGAAGCQSAGTLDFTCP